jgi:hypothetical protein
MRLSVGSAMSLVDINRIGGIPEISRVIYNLPSLRNVYYLAQSALGSALISEMVTLGNLCLGDERLHIEDIVVADADFDQTAYVGCEVWSETEKVEPFIVLAKSGYVTSGGRSISIPIVPIDRIYDPVPYGIKWVGQYIKGYVIVRIISARKNLSRFASVVTGGTNVVSSNLIGYDSYSDATATLVEKARIDFGSAKNIRKFANKVKYYISASATGNLVRCEVSADGTNWTTLWQDTAPPTTETTYYYVFENLTNIRYVRWLVNSGATTSTIYLKNYPLFAWEG